MKNMCSKCKNRAICEVYEQQGVLECFGYEPGINEFPFKIGDIIYAVRKSENKIEKIRVEDEYSAIHIKSCWNRTYFPTFKAAKLVMQSQKKIAVE